MAIVKTEIEVAKELGEVFDLVGAILIAIKNKTGYESLIPALITAVDGVGQLDDEFKANLKAAINTAQLKVVEIIFKMAEKKEEITAPVQA